MPLSKAMLCICNCELMHICVYVVLLHFNKAVANGPVGQVLAGPLFLKVKTKFHFTKSK